MEAAAEGEGAGSAGPRVAVPRPPAMTRPKRPQSAPAREPRVKSPGTSTWRGMRTHHEEHQTRPGSAASTATAPGSDSATRRRPQSARPASAAGSVRRGAVGDWGDGEERRFAERKAPLPLSARARLRPRSAAARLDSDRSDARTRDPNDFARSECYTRLRKRYERSKGALGNSETGKPPAKPSDWFQPPRANVHCPACLLEETGLRKDLDETRRQAAQAAAQAAAQVKAMEEDIAAQRAEARSFELALLKKTAERDDENTALKEAIAELQKQLRDMEQERDLVASKLEEAERHEAALMAERNRLRVNAEQEKASADVLRLQLEDAMRVDVPTLANKLSDIVFDDSRELEILLRALLGRCTIEQQHKVLSVTLDCLDEHLDASLLPEPLLPNQNEHLTQWLLRLNEHSPRVLLHATAGSPQKTRSLLVRLLQFAEREWNCTVGSVINKLLVAEEMYATPGQLGLAPERLVAHTFGVSRQGQDDQSSGVFQSTQTDGPMLKEEEEEGEDAGQGSTKGRSRQRKGRRRSERVKKTNLKVVRANPLTLRLARQRVAKLYEKKAVADAVDDEKGHRRDEMPEFVAEYMIHEFGLPSLANRATSQLTASVIKFSKRKSVSAAECEQLCRVPNPERYDRRLRLFGQVCGLQAAQHDMTYHPSDADLLVDLLATLYTPETIDEKYGGDAQPRLPLDHCLGAIETVWLESRGLAIPESLKSALVEVSAAEVDRVTSKVVPMTDVDALLEATLAEWTSRRASVVERLETLFREHDLDGNGVLSFSEFSNLIFELVETDEVADRPTNADGSTDNTSWPSQKQLARMYQEAVEDTLEMEEDEMDDDAISPAAFASTVQRYGLVHVHAASEGHQTAAEHIRIDHQHHGKKKQTGRKSLLTPTKSAGAGAASAESGKLAARSQLRTEKGGLQERRRIKRGASMEDIGIIDIRGTAGALHKDIAGVKKPAVQENQ